MQALRSSCCASIRVCDFHNAFSASRGCGEIYVTGVATFTQTVPLRSRRAISFLMTAVIEYFRCVDTDSFKYRLEKYIR